LSAAGIPSGCGIPAAKLQEPPKSPHSGGELDVVSFIDEQDQATSIERGDLPSQLQIGLRPSNVRVDAAEVDAKGVGNFADVVPSL